MSDDILQPEAPARPTAIHYALVISVCINVVLALSWAMAENALKVSKERARSLSAEVSALKNAAEDREQEKKPAQ